MTYIHKILALSPLSSKKEQRGCFRYQWLKPSPLPDPSLYFLKSAFPIHCISICICISKITMHFVTTAVFPQYSAFSYFHRAWTTCRWILTTSLQTSPVDSNTICNYVIYISTGKLRKVNVPVLLTEFFLHHTILFLCEENKSTITVGDKRTEPNRPGSC